MLRKVVLDTRTSAQVVVGIILPMFDVERLIANLLMLCSSAHL